MQITTCIRADARMRREKAIGIVHPSLLSRRIP